MDTKALFHNPSALTDGELKTMQRKLNTQRFMPLMTTAFLAGASVSFDTYILRSAVCKYRLVGGAMAGYVMGAVIVNGTQNWLTHRNWDCDIMNAYDRRWMNKALTAGGFGNNWVHTSQSENNPSPKPY